LESFEFIDGPARAGVRLRRFGGAQSDGAACSAWFRLSAVNKHRRFEEELMSNATKVRMLWSVVVVALYMTADVADAKAFLLRQSPASCWKNASSIPFFQGDSSNFGNGVVLEKGTDISQGQVFCPYPETDTTLKSSIAHLNVHARTSGGLGFTLKVQGCVGFFNAEGGTCDAGTTGTSVGTGQLDVIQGRPSSWSNSNDGSFPYVVVTATSGSVIWVKGLFYSN